MEIPELFETVLSDYAKREDVTPETALSNLMDFIQLKDESFANVTVAVESPALYLSDEDEIADGELLQYYMDLFGEDGPGARVNGYYRREKADILILEIEYDDLMPLWDILSLFRIKIPSMDLDEGIDEEGNEVQVLRLSYLRDNYGGVMELSDRLFDELDDPKREEDGYEKAGYYEPAYEDLEED